MAETSKSDESLLRRSRITGRLFEHPRLVLGLTAFGVLVVLCLIILYLPMDAKWFVPLFYLYGALPFAYIFTYLTKRKEVDKLGSRNISVSNAYRVGGWLAGTLTVVGEASKGLLPLLASWSFFDYELSISAAFVLCAMLGTFYSPFLKGSGGLGTTMFIWAAIFLAPLTTAIVLVIFVALYFLLEDTYLITLIAFWSSVPVLLVLDRQWPLVLLALVYCVIYTSRYSRKKDELAHGVKVAKD
jgi:glycerol-3-phosphate acyltransferase PlsY